MGTFDVTKEALKHTTLFNDEPNPKRDWDFVALKAREVLKKAQLLEATSERGFRFPKPFARSLRDGAEQLAQAVDELAATETARRANK
jgi:hypothetical protein